MKVETTQLPNGDIEVVVKRDSGHGIAAVRVSYESHDGDQETFGVELSCRDRDLWQVTGERARVLDGVLDVKQAGTDEEVAAHFGELIAEMSERTGKSEQEVMYELARNYWDAETQSDG